jgi:hypothetical protein
VGETPEWIRNHPLLAGVDVPNTGGNGFSIQMVTGSLLVQTRAHSSGTSQIVPDAPLMLNARDKQTGEILASVELPAPGQYGMMTYMHEGRTHGLSGFAGSAGASVTRIRLALEAGSTCQDAGRRPQTCTMRGSAATVPGSAATR